MKVNEEEAIAVQAVARMINEQISAFKSIYTTQDDLNIALMCCLKIATDHYKQQHQTEFQSKEVLENLASLEKHLENTMKES